MVSKEPLPLSEANPFQLGSRFKSTAKILFNFELLVCYLDLVYLVLLFKLIFLSLFRALFLRKTHQILIKLYCTWGVLC